MESARHNVRVLGFARLLGVKLGQEDASPRLGPGASRRASQPKAQGARERPPSPRDCGFFLAAFVALRRLASMSHMTVADDNKGRCMVPAWLAADVVQDLFSGPEYHRVAVRSFARRLLRTLTARPDGFSEAAATATASGRASVLAGDKDELAATTPVSADALLVALMESHMHLYRAQLAAVFREADVNQRSVLNEVQKGALRAGSQWRLCRAGRVVSC
jgi:hypothetical protein